MSEVVFQYLDAVEGDRGQAIRTVFGTVQRAMPDGYQLTDFRGAPSWVIPLSTYPVTYNKEPLSYVALMAHKSYLSLYLMGLHTDSDEEKAFRDAWATTGLTLNLGKSCLRFRSLDDVDLDIISRTVASTPPERLIAFYEQSRQ